MTKKELNKIIKLHRKWINGTGGERANLSGADLRGADLSGADLSGANFFGADLFGADLSRANLSGTDLSRTDLSRANLSGTDLSGADLSGTDLREAKYSISQILYQIYWYGISDKMILELMRHDAEFIGTEKMQKWADGGDCPYGVLRRDFHFSEDRELWKPGKPKLRGKKLFEALAKEINLEVK